ncbi:MAG TPA: carboxymuconolactone decarboxylase family protein [Acidimicrobiales bacterium]|nr:carboxymuconolactone decarboxylase family protein [Acidimicrobiales bacterium]
MDTSRGPRPDSPRIPPLSDPEPSVQAVLDAAAVPGGASGAAPLNIFATLAHHPKVMRRSNQLGGTLLFSGSLPARDREIVILRVGWNCRSVYEFGQHTVIGARSGLSPEEIRALAGGDLDAWSGQDRALVALADDLCERDCVSDATWSVLAERLGNQEMIELVVLAGYYRLISGFLNSTGVQLDPGVPGWPEGAVP